MRHQGQPPWADGPDGLMLSSRDGEPVMYYVGVIDILCEYGLKKQLEHHYKAAKHGEKVGAQNFSVVDPLQYSTRFQNFIADGLV